MPEKALRRKAGRYSIKKSVLFDNYKIYLVRLDNLAKKQFAIHGKNDIISIKVPRSDAYPSGPGKLPPVLSETISEEGKTMKKRIYAVLIFFALSAAGLAVAAAEPPAQPAPAAPAATNLAAGYPAAAAQLPPLPTPPASIEDAKATAAYIAAVDAYLKASQLYIDAATNDANLIIKERNAAIENANKAVADYNAFFKIDTKK
ncbi:hypothetical protein [Sporomusa ovata]|nr:hypothetical protein [Sporomusa ovata]